MIRYKSEEEVKLIEESCKIVCGALSIIASEIKLGIETIFLDKIAEEYIRDQGGIPGFKGYQGFPNSLCISINSGVVHGIPSKQEISEGDVISIDCGVLKNGYYGDSAYTFVLDGANDEHIKLCTVTKESLYVGIEEAKKGKRIGDIGYSIQNYVEKHGYSVVRDLVGHGIGKNLHEEPKVPNYGRKGSGALIKRGLVIAIEPMINVGESKVVVLDDGWTVATKDGKFSAHYEHTIAVELNGPKILSNHGVIEDRVTKNNNLVKI